MDPSQHVIVPSPLMGFKPLLMSLKSSFIIQSTLIWKEPMRIDHPPLNFDAKGYYTSNAYFIAYVKNKKLKKV